MDRPRPGGQSWKMPAPDRRLAGSVVLTIVTDVVIFLAFLGLAPLVLL